MNNNNAGPPPTRRSDEVIDISTQREEESTRINMEDGTSGTSPSTSSSATRLPNSRNLLLLFNEARRQASASYPGTSTQQPTEASDRPGVETSQMLLDRDASPHSPSSRARHARSWRMNLNDVLSFSSAPTTEALRSFITHSGSFRYTPLSTNESAGMAGDNIHLLLNQGSRAPPVSDGEYRMTARSNALRDESTMQPQQHSSSSVEPVAGGTSTALATATISPPIVSVDEFVSTSNRQNNGNIPTRHSNSSNNSSSNRNNAPQATNAGADVDEDNNVISDIFVKVLSHFVRYLPFICILFVKFIHDHLLGILDLLLLHGIMYQVNKSLCEQIAKFSQKSYGILLRDFSLVAFVVAYRFVLASSMPDPFGLLIAPPAESVTIEVSSISKSSSGAAATNGEQQSSAAEVLRNYLGQLAANTKSATSTTDPLDNGVTITMAISLGVLLYYVAVNDLIVKLITILVKISITMMPTRIIRHKPRARMFVLVEYLSQFYRALSPVRQWLMFLFKSYSGLEVISGILFSSFYMGAKGFEFVERGKSLRKALINFLRNMDYERKPTNEELDAAGSLCPICHDSYNTPVVLECNHIFCDDCVSTWFKREQTCPMCRAKVSEDPTWQDGSTTFFYQLC